MSKPTVFLSYSHLDDDWKTRLEKHLQVLDDELDVWSDKRIRAGDDWFPEIESAMDRANAAVLLVTANLLTSKFIRTEELPHLLDRRERDGLLVVPIIVKPCAWTAVDWLSRMQVRPVGATPLSTLSEAKADEAMTNIVIEIYTRLAEKRKESSVQEASPAPVSDSAVAEAAISEPVPGDVWVDPVVGMRFRYIPPGTFMMGSPDGEPDRDDDEHPHQVELTRGFWMAETVVTQGQWRMLMGNNPSYFSDGGDDHPVEKVTWYEALAFANALSRSSGLGTCYQLGEYDRSPGTGMTCAEVSWVNQDCDGFRLPTETEWEYAARAETQAPFATGNNITTDQANFDGRYPYNGNQKGICREKTVAVRSFKANHWGLHEMHGNVWEWCWDWYGLYPQGPLSDPTGPHNGEQRLLRGGAFTDRAGALRSANRNRYLPDDQFWNIGFRCVRTYRRQA
jgi:formylglycine-generating enzyme required for sulfatase activity